MGILWRFTMVLLSTLAAFVIIVHTAEEDMELIYRRNLQSRNLDNETSQYEQTWRASEVDPSEQKTIQLPTDIWNNNSPEELPKRRRPGRKRKRRPQQQYPNEDLKIQERYPSPEEPQQADIESGVRNVQETGTPKRRRKKLDQSPYAWQSDQGETSERPLRRRGHRRKRPPLSTLPELSEFRVSQPEEIHLSSALDPSEITDERIYTDTEGIRQLIEQNQSGNDDQPEIKTERVLVDFREQKTDDSSATQHKESMSQLTSAKEDKSLSEFSLEVPNSLKHSKITHLTDSQTDNFLEKVKDKSFGIVRSFNKVQNKGPMDPVTLKDILKRSNGTSLSEILQQHNLSLADLLSGRESAISILNSEDSFETPSTKIMDSNNQNKQTDKIASNFRGINKAKTENNEESLLINLETKHGATRLVYENDITTQSVQTNFQEEIKNDNKLPFATTVNAEIIPKLVTRRRLPGNRKRLRMRPMMNSTYKSQLSRDLMVLSPRQDIMLWQRNKTKRVESMEVLNFNDTKGSRVNKNSIVQRNPNEYTTTILDVINEPSFDNTSSQTSQDNANGPDSTKIETSITVSTVNNNVKSKVEIPLVRHPVNSSTLRRQAFNNRLNKKRQKHKNTTESQQHGVFKNLFGVSDLVSSSEFIERTEPIKPDKNEEIMSSLQDFMTTTTKIPKTIDNMSKARLSNQGRTLSTTKSPYISSTPVETAKIEIEEILNDIGTRARLSEILMERNMTLSELVEHRERGSSNIHLADIFQNTSKEPNPPVPFLSKSLIEPISKETYPLRALLDANLHESNAKVATSYPGRGYVNIPVVMDFGNNVNENAENMGIMSLFSNFTKHGETANKNIKQESTVGAHETVVIDVNGTHDKNGNVSRKGKIMNNDNNQDDIVSWNEIFTLMRKTYKNDTGTIPETLKEGPTPIEAVKKLSLDEDIDGDGMIVFEDLQHLKDFDSKVSPRTNEKVEVKTYERIETATEVTGILDKIPSQTKSVTVATACIAGLAMVLFLLTYAAFKWKQEKNSLQKRDVEGENIPSPVFENRKGHHNNSSMRSISPMLSTSNIYTLNTLDSRNGKESPEYMWDTLQKPFQ